MDSLLTSAADFIARNAMWAGVILGVVTFFELAGGGGRPCGRRRAGPLHRHRRLRHRRRHGRRHLLLDRSPSGHARAASPPAGAAPPQAGLDAPVLPPLRRGFHLHRPLLRAAARLRAGDGRGAADAPARLPDRQCQLGLRLGAGHAGAGLSGGQGPGQAGDDERGAQSDPVAAGLRCGGAGAGAGHALAERPRGAAQCVAGSLGARAGGITSSPRSRFRAQAARFLSFVTLGLSHCRLPLIPADAGIQCFGFRAPSSAVRPWFGLLTGSRWPGGCRALSRSCLAAGSVVGVAVGLGGRGRARGAPGLAVFALEPERLALSAADFVHVVIEQAAVDHGVADLGRVPQVLERIGVQHDQVGQLADFQRADVLVHAQGAGAVDGADAQGFVGAHAALFEHPQLPVGAETFTLTVGADLDRDALIHQPLGLTRDGDVVQLLRRGLHRTTRARIQDAARHVLGQDRILPDVRRLIPVVLAPGAAEADDQGRGVGRPRLRPQLHRVVVHPLHRHRVLDGGVAVDQHAHVGVVQRAAFRHDHHAQFAGSLHDLLALVAAGLVVALDAPGADGLHPAQVRARVVQVVDHGRRRRGRSVQDGAGREDARRHHAPGLGQFAVGEDLAVVVRRIVQRRHAEGQGGVVHPALLRDDLVRTHAAVPVGVDQAGDDGLAGHVHDAGAGRNRDRAARADGLDAVAVDDHHAVLDHLFALHGDQAGAGQDGDAAGTGVIGAEADFDPVFGGLGQVSRRAVHEGEAFAQRTREQLRAHRPLQATGIAGPVQPLAGVAGDARLRQGLGVGADRDRASGRDEGGDIGVEAFGPGDPPLVRRDGELGRPFAAQVGALVLARQVDGLQDALLAVAGAQEDAIVAGAELRIGAGISDLDRLAAAHGDAVDARFAAPHGRAQIAVAGGAIDDRLAVRREARLQIVAGVGRDGAAFAAGDGNHADGAQVLVVPGRVNDGAAVTRPGRVQLEMVALARQAAGRSGHAVAQVADPQIAQGFEHHLGAVGRGLRPADHLHVELGRGHVDGEAGGFLHPAGVGDAEGHFADGLGGHVDAADLAARPDNDGAIVRRPGEARIDAVDGPGLLHVAVQSVVDRRLTPGLQVHDIEHRLVAVAAHEGERLAVRRRGRAHRAAGAGDEGLDLARLAIQAADHIELGVRILGVFKDAARRGVVAEVHVAAVGREGGLARVLLLGAALGQLHAAAAARAVVHPHLARAQRARGGEVLAPDDELAVRRPGGGVQQAEGLAGHLARVGAVAVHDPQVVAARAVRGEGDETAVRRIARLHVPGDARGDGAGFAAADRHHIDVAQQVEDDLAPVGADVQRHPGAFVDVDVDVALGADGVLHVPFRRRFGPAWRGRLCERRKGHGQRRSRGHQNALHEKPLSPSNKT
uniref:BON domain-containing protein n=1 Tax=Parastrongyloides trichosuri TaxID=131310 RepID=A0A0N4Z2Z0_PARTI